MEIKLETTKWNSTRLVLRTLTLKEDTCTLSQLKSPMDAINIPPLNLSHATTTAHMAFSLSEPKCLMVTVHGLNFGFYLDNLKPNMEDGQHADKLISMKVFRARSKSTVLPTSEAQAIIIMLHQITY